MRNTILVFKSTVVLGTVSLLALPMVAASCAAEADRRDLPADGVVIGASIEQPRVDVPGPVKPELSNEERIDALKQRYAARADAKPFGQVSGRITDIDGAPIAGVTVRVDNQRTRTDATGAYALPQVPLGIYVVSFEHPQYVFTQRSASVLPGSDPWVETSLLQRSKVQHFDAEKGAIIHQGPLTLDFEPQDLAFEDGSPIHGEVDVIATAIDPRERGHISAAPARLEGISLSGAEVGLVSYGMLEVEIFQGTRRVQVRPGQTVRTSFQLGEKAGLSTGDTVPLWHHDTSRGLWVQERERDATVRSANGELAVEAELPHFSSWNFDSLADATCSKFSVTINNTSAKTLLKLRVYSTDSNGVKDGSVTASGTPASTSPYYWEFQSDCAQRSAGATKSYTCLTNVPTGRSMPNPSPNPPPVTYGQYVYFAMDVQIRDNVTNAVSWVPLNSAGLSSGTSRLEKAFWLGAEIRDWMEAEYPGASSLSSWCGTPTPATGYGVHLAGQYNLSIQPNGLRPLLFTLPGNVWNLNAVGPGAVVNAAPNFQTMRMNVAPNNIRVAAGLPPSPTPFSNDADRDGVTDSIDNCQDISNPDQVDYDHNGVGDVCESWCFVPAGPDAAWYDTDSDGIDDICDNNWLTSNPDQYMPVY